MTILAVSRDDVADYVGTLFFVYSLLVIAYVVTSLFFAFGARPPDFRWLDAVLDFQRDVAEPLLRPFRKIIPQLGPLDLSPLVALIALQIVGGIIVSLIRG